MQALRPLAPRLYSIASSQEAVGEEAHLTVALVDYAHGRSAPGCRLGPPRQPQGEQARARVFIEQSALQPARRRLRRHDHGGPRHGRGAVPRLPAAARGAGRGRSQLAVLRRPPPASDFHYRLTGSKPWGFARRPGSDLAFSRDPGPERIYVPGPHGAARPRTVRLAGKRRLLLRLRRRRAAWPRTWSRHCAPSSSATAACSSEAAVAYVRRLGADKRYVRDVY